MLAVIENHDPDEKCPLCGDSGEVRVIAVFDVPVFDAPFYPCPHCTRADWLDDDEGATT